MDVYMSVQGSTEAQSEYVEWLGDEATAPVGPLSFAVPLVHGYFLIGCWIYGIASGSVLACFAWIVLPVAVLAFEFAAYLCLSRLRLRY